MPSKKKVRIDRAETRKTAPLPAGSRPEAAGPGAAGVPRRSGDGKPAGRLHPSALSQHWPLLVALTSLAAVLLAVVMIGLNLASVAGAGRVTIVNSPDPVYSGDGGAAPSSATGPARRTKGSPQAPVVIEEWFDFQCPGCGRFAREIEPEIDRLYVNTGKIRFVSRNFAFLGPESFLAAEAAEAAADQGRYWAYRALLFARQQGENRGGYSADNLKRYAAELGLDQRTFNDTLDRGVHRAAVLAESREARANGINSTPSFTLNGRLINGIPSLQAFGTLIEEEIARKK